MDHQEAEVLAQDLKELACKSCTEGWLEKHDRLTDPIKDIQDCAALGLITSTLKERLINEILELKSV